MQTNGLLAVVFRPALTRAPTNSDRTLLSNIPSFLTDQPLNYSGTSSQASLQAVPSGQPENV